MSEQIAHQSSRRVLLRKGLLLGAGAVVAGVAAPFLTSADAARAYVSGLGNQPGWAWCDKCQGLFYKPFQGSSWCPAGGRHDGSESHVYNLDYGYVSESGSLGQQADWAWCDKCQGLFYGLFQSSSWCPAGGRHDGSESYNYDMAYGYANICFTNGNCLQNSWLWCDKCQGLFYGPFQGSSWCPAGGRHDGSESRSYTMQYVE